MESIHQKPCTRCGQTKPHSEFHNTKAALDGLSWYCKECRRELDRRYREAHRPLVPQRLPATQRTCPICGKVFMRRPTHPGNCCSPACGFAHRRQPLSKRFWSKVDKSGGPNACWLWLGGMSLSGYGEFTISKHPDTHRAHRIAYELTYGRILPGLLVCHNCPNGDNRACVNPAHLWVGTPADNSADMAQKGRASRGEKHSRARLTETDVREIRALYRMGVNGVALALRYNVTHGTIYRVLNNQSWQHIK